MEDNRIYPLTFAPVLKNYVWGGRRLETLFGRSLPDGIVAESWEISGHSNGLTCADRGPWEGQPLSRILDALGESLVGSRAAWALARGKFPLLVKLLDAHEALSLQLHPNDEYAMAHEHGELGKTEMWYVLHAEPGAELIMGLQPGTTRETLRAALKSGDVDHVLRRVPIRAGDAIGIPAGTVHALLAGTVVTEILQNSDTTYRLHDWGRLGPDGKPRPLHIRKGLESVDYEQQPPSPISPHLVPGTTGFRWAPLVQNTYFVSEEVVIEPGGAFQGTCDGETMEIWGCLSGEVTVEWQGEPVTLSAIRYALLPAVLGEYRIISDRESVCLRVYLPDR